MDKATPRERTFLEVLEENRVLQSKLAKYEALHESWRTSEDFFKQHLAKHIDYVLTGDKTP